MLALVRTSGGTSSTVGVGVRILGLQAQTGGIDLAPENNRTVTNGENLESSRCIHRD